MTLISEFATPTLCAGDKIINCIFTASQIATGLLLNHIKNFSKNFPPIPLLLGDKSDYMECYFEGLEDDPEKDLADVCFFFYDLEKGSLSELTFFAMSINGR